MFQTNLLCESFLSIPFLFTIYFLLKVFGFKLFLKLTEIGDLLRLKLPWGSIFTRLALLYVIVVAPIVFAWYCLNRFRPLFFIEVVGPNLIFSTDMPKVFRSNMEEVLFKVTEVAEQGFIRLMSSRDIYLTIVALRLFLNPPALLNAFFLFLLLII